MTTLCLLVTALPLALANRQAAADLPPRTQQIRTAVAKALPLIRKGAAGHMAQRTCFACHHQAIPILALSTAQARGIADDADDMPQHLEFIAKFLGKNRAGYLQGRGQGGQVDTAGYALWTLEMGNWEPDETTAAVTEYLLRYNKNLPHWRTTSNRPPSEASPFTASYVAIRALQAFGTAEQQERIDERLRTVRDWLVRTPARDTEDRVFRLWGLRRTGAEGAEVKRAAEELIRSQRPDGGWAQREGMDSDAYATGTALVALHEAGGLATADPVYRRGVRFLLRTQRADGTWHVRSRSRPFQVYFESGFPYGKDQFISLAASGWATTALALALPRPPAEQVPAPRAAAPAAARGSAED